MEIALNRVAADASLPNIDVEFGSPTEHRGGVFTDGTNVPTARGERRYLIASITKPIVAMALVKLAADGEIAFSERLGSVLPSFQKGAFRRITLRHLLTHTSGLPDMLPNNTELRAAHASLADFTTQATDIDLEFATATDCRYSSVGFLLIGEIVTRLTGMPVANFLATQFFEPLQMNNTWLGIPEDKAADLLPTILPCALPHWQEGADKWGWNSPYWQTLGAPWGGMISTAAELGRFASMILRNGVTPEGQQLLPASAVAAAISDQTAEITAQSGYIGPVRPWGFGWRRQWASHSASFGDFVSPTSVGHWGATGTLMWIDPSIQRYAVILTTTPYEQSQSVVQRLSNVCATT